MDKKITKVALAVPAATSLAGWWRKFSVLERDADDIVAAWRRLCAMQSQLRHRRPGEPPPDIDEAQLSDHVRAILPRARAAMLQMDSSANYEPSEEGETILKKHIVAERLAVMLNGVTFKSGDADGYSDLLLEHVHASAQTFLGLETCCRRIEGMEDFTGRIYTVVTELSVSEAVWRWRRAAIDEIEPLSAQVREAIAEAVPRCALERAKDAALDAQHRVTRQRALVVESQSAARAAYQSVEATMLVLDACQQILNDANAALARARATLQRETEP